MTNSQSLMMDSSPPEQRAHAGDTTTALMRAYGGHELAFFGLAPENLHFLAPEETGLVNYRLVGNVAVVLGDPVCAPEACEQVTRSFLDFCAQHHWRVAFYQAQSERLALYRALKLRAFKMGEEAILDPQTFTLDGSAIANVRTSCRRAEREGVTLSWYEGVPPAAVMQQLEYISHAWLEHKSGKQASESGFSTGRLDELPATAERAEALATFSTPAYVLPSAVPRLVTVVATTSTGQACACVTFTPIYGYVSAEAMVSENPFEMHGWGWSLDMMRRTPDAPPGVMELLLVRAIERFRSCGACRVSLGLVALVDSRQEMMPAGRQLVGIASDRLHLLETRRTLFKFKQKFHPDWESRYLVSSTLVAWPKVALAVFRLRNYSGKRDARQRPDPDRPLHPWRRTAWQFLRYCLVGVANTFIDVLTLNALLWRLPTHNVLALVAYNSVAYSSGAVSSFFFNKYWTFGHTQRTTGRQVFRFVIILFLEILFSNGLVWLAGRMLQPVIANPLLWANASKFLAVAAGAVLSYICMRCWIFASGSRKQS